MQSQEKPPSEATTMEPRNDEIFPLSNKPFHGVILTKSHVHPTYIMSLPAKFHSVLPAIVIPGVIYCGGKEWRVDYYGNRHNKTLKTRDWRKFVNDNNLKNGDGCVFELMECSSTILKFRVQILRGDIPIQLRDKCNGESKQNPINIE